MADRAEKLNMDVTHRFEHPEHGSVLECACCELWSGTLKDLIFEEVLTVTEKGNLLCHKCHRYLNTKDL